MNTLCTDLPAHSQKNPTFSSYANSSNIIGMYIHKYRNENIPGTIPGYNIMILLESQQGGHYERECQP